MFDLELPFHPTIPDLQALGYTKRGRVIWPVMGGNGEGGSGDGDAGGDGSGDGAGAGGDGDGGAGSGPKPNAVDQFGKDLGYPADTSPRDMSVEQQANFYKHQQRRKDDKLKEYNGITPEEAIRLKNEAEERRRNGLQPDERAIEDARTEAAAAGKQEAAAEWAGQLTDAIVGQFVTDEAQRAAVVAGINPMTFVKDGKFDKDALVGHLTGLAAAFGGQSPAASTPPSQWGQSGSLPPAQSGREQGLAEAKRRGYTT